MRACLPVTLLVLLSAASLTAQAGTFTVYGSGCPGSGGTSCLSANWNQTFAGNTGVAANFALPFTTGSTPLVVCGVELICKTLNNTNVNMTVSLYDTSSSGAPGNVVKTGTTPVTGSMPVTGTVKANRVNFPVTVLAKNTQYFIVFDNRVGLNLPIMSSGTTNVHWYNGPPTWRGPFTSVRWNYSVICCGAGPVPKISSTGVPTIGKSFSIDLSQAAASAKTLLALGLAKTNTDLTPFGAPGCTLLTNPLAVLGYTSTASGTLSVPLSVPNDQTFLGVQFFSQFAVNDTVNALQLVFSAGGDGKVGK